MTDGLPEGLEEVLPLPRELKDMRGEGLALEECVSPKAGSEGVASTGEALVQTLAEALTLALGLVVVLLTGDVEVVTD